MVERHAGLIGHKLSIIRINALSFTYSELNTSSILSTGYFVLSLLFFYSEEELGEVAYRSLIFQ